MQGLLCRDMLAAAGLATLCQLLPNVTAEQTLYAWASMRLAWCGKCVLGAAASIMQKHVPRHAPEMPQEGSS